MDWGIVFKIVASVVASFGAGWATAVLSDVSPQKAIATGIAATCAYWLGQVQTPAVGKKP